MRTFWLMAACCSLHLSPAACLAEAAKGPPDRTLPWVTEAARAPRVAFRTFDSQVIGAKVSYHIYSPADYDRTESRFPVLYWLHGTEGGIVGIRPLAALFDDAIQAGKAPPMMIVFVNGLPRSLWADSKGGAAPVETVFITELIPDVDRNFRTVARRSGRILEGFSMGGYGAARLGFRHPDLFAGISILAGGPLDLDFQGPRARRNPRLRERMLKDVCGNELDYFREISPWTIAATAAESLRKRRLVIRHTVGERDDTRDLNRRFHDHLSALKIDHEYSEAPEVGHDALALLNALGEDNWKFYQRALERARADD